jgi:hypothetical protein
MEVGAQTLATVDNGRRPVLGSMDGRRHARWDDAVAATGAAATRSYRGVGPDAATRTAPGAEGRSSSSAGEVRKPAWLPFVCLGWHWESAAGPATGRELGEETPAWRMTAATHAETTPAGRPALPGSGPPLTRVTHRAASHGVAPVGRSLCVAKGNMVRRC